MQPICIYCNKTPEELAEYIESFMELPSVDHLTGSYAYEKPRRIGGFLSDIDVVIVVEDDVLNLLRTHCDNAGSAKTLQRRGGISVRFGLLNLLCVSEEEFPLLKAKTDELIVRKPVSRDEAVKVFKELLGEEEEPF